MFALRYFLRRLTAVSLIFLLLATGCTPGDSAETDDTLDPTDLRMDTLEEGAFVVRENSEEPLPIAEPIPFNVGENLYVEPDGVANIRLGSVLTSTVLAGGDVTVQRLGATDESVTMTIRQNDGVTLNQFNPTRALDHLLAVETDRATITTQSGEFVVVRSEPLEWVINVAEDDRDVTVTTRAATEQIPPMTARWITPEAAFGAAIDIEGSGFADWLTDVRRGRLTEPLTEIMLPPADIQITSASLPDVPAPGNPFELVSNDQGMVMMTLDSVGIFGRPNYFLEDCNEDGNADIVVQEGILHFDFNTMLARTVGIDVTVINRAEGGQGALAALDVNGREVDRRLVTVAEGGATTLTLRASEPYYGADLVLMDGCFLGLSLTPPTPGGDPGAPRGALTAGQSTGSVVVNTAAPADQQDNPPTEADGTSTGDTPQAQPQGDRVQLQAYPIGGDAITIDGDLTDWNTLPPVAGRTWVVFNTIAFDENCAARHPDPIANTDLGGQMRLAHGDGSLFVAFLVEDDGYVGYSGDDLRYFLGDAPQLSVDTNLLSDLDDVFRSGDDWQIDFYPGDTLAGGSPQVALWQLSELTVRNLSEATVAVSQTETGYFLEAEIPWSALNVAPTAGDRMGIAVNVNDNDTPGTDVQECIISTSPTWTWDNPTSWGTLLLSQTN